MPRCSWARMFLAVSIVLAALLSCFAVGCAGKQEKAKAKVFTVGVEAPFTGPCARSGAEIKLAYTMAFEEVNYKVGDYDVKLVWIDDQSDPEKATKAYEDAVLRDKIDCGTCNWHSSVSVALMDVTAKHKVPHFFGFAAAETINEKYKSDPQRYSYWMGKTWPSPRKLQAPGYVAFLEEAVKAGILDPANKRIALFGEDTDWGRSFVGAMGEELERVGWQVVSQDFFSLKEMDYYPLLTKLKGKNVPVIAGTATSAPGYAAFLKQAREVGLKSLIIADGLACTAEWYELAGEASDYVLDQECTWVTPEAKRFVAEFERRAGYKPSPVAGGLAYDLARFLIKVAQETLKEHGEINRETLYKVGQEKLWTGQLTFTEGIMMKEYKYTPETVPDPVVGPGYYVYPVVQFFKGEPKILWPAEWKEADLQLPPWATQK